MSNWTPKRALSGLMSKFRQSDSEESLNSSSAEEAPQPPAPTASQPPAYSQQEDDDNDEPVGLSTSDVAVSPLALMNENSPEAWLGQFLLKLEAPTSTPRGTIAGARNDQALMDYLHQARDAAAPAQPLRLLQPGYADSLRASDWSAWWKAQGALLSFCYSTLALALLGETSHIEEVEAIYQQEVNLQMQKDAHYVLCYLLNKPWPSYHVSEADIARLSSRA